jgi:DNA-binding transcriptional regulator YiaG
MPSYFAAAFKAQISRLSRAELRSQSLQLKKELALLQDSNRRLRTELKSLTKDLRRIDRHFDALAKVSRPSEPDLRFRFSPERLRRQRERLGMSSASFAKLVGVSAQSIYLWEHGRSRPRARQIASIAALRGIGKRELKKRVSRTL